MSLSKIKIITAQEPLFSFISSAYFKKVYSAAENPFLIAYIGFYGKFSSLTIYYNNVIEN